jgi:hypothetical protein
MSSRLYFKARVSEQSLDFNEITPQSVSIYQGKKLYSIAQVLLVGRPNKLRRTTVLVRPR